MDYAKLDQPEVLAVLFHPRRDETPPPAGAVDVEIPVADGVVVGGRFFLAAEPAVANILFFHGNGEVAADYDDIGPRYNARGISLLAVDYRGYGRSTGSPAASAMLADAHLVLQWVKEWLKTEQRTGPLVVMGRSLGCAPALELAATKDPAIAGLIIESGFALTVPLLENLGLDTASLGIAEGDCFRNQLKIVSFQKPTYILHAQYDQIIPLVNAETLQAQSGAQAKEFAIIPGADHNNIIERVGEMYFSEIRRFMGKIGKPQRRAKPGVRG
ncbi:MAG: alpha/beta hydrolase [Desulfobulbaceae bacterium]|nr:alpha/beta hydrolase [Desulfobulbaceae bacterium]